MTFLYLFFFCIHILFLQCFASPFSYTLEPKTELHGFRTLWKPYTQLSLVFLRHSSDNMETTTPMTTYITIDGGHRTPNFLNDYYYYDDRPLGTVKKRLIMRHMFLNSAKKQDYPQRFQLLQDNIESISDDLPMPFQDLSMPFQESLNTTANATSSATFTTTTLTTTTLTTKTNAAVAFKKKISGKKVNIGAYCYVCGLEEPGLPYEKCYRAFESYEHIFPYMAYRRKYKKHCIQGTKKNTFASKEWYGAVYRGGCFKRYTDVGHIYYERGCRTMKPYVGASFASQRFAKLEKLLYGVDNGCVFSPHAELTPFSRAISLYVRYHVCVCKGKYCNGATSVTSSHISIIIVILSWL